MNKNKLCSKIKPMKKLIPPWSGKPEKKAWYTVNSNECSACDVDTQQDIKSVEPVTDNRLKNWEKWMSVRKKEQKKIAKAVGKDVTDLSMNAEERFRLKQEENELLDLAGDLKEILPFCVPFAEMNGEPPLYAQKTKIQKGIVPYVTRTGIPKKIWREKGFDAEKRSKDLKESLFQTCHFDYKQNREKFVKDEMDLILPHKPDTENLIIVGKRPKETEPELIINVPIITLNMDSEISEVVEPYVTVPQTEGIMSLKIDDTILLTEPVGYEATHIRTLIQEKMYSLKDYWLINFITTPHVVTSEKLILKNLGTTSIKYDWRFVEYPLTFMKAIHSRSPFCFNRRCGVLIPGEERAIQIWYSTKSPQINCETWELITYPIFSENKLLIKLCGLTTVDPSDISNIKNYIDSRVKNNIATSILDEIISTFSCDVAEETVCSNLYADEIVFNVKNPKYFYHMKGVADLRNIYDRLNDSFDPWNLSIKTIRCLIIQLDQPEQNDCFEELQKILQMFLHPRFNISFKSCDKYFITYTLLANFLNQFEELDIEITHIIDSAKCMDVDQPNAYLKSSFVNVTKESSLFKKEYCVSVYENSKCNRRMFGQMVYCHFALAIENMDIILQTYDENKELL